MRAFGLSGIVLIFVLMTPLTSWAGWVEAKSENFIFVGDASEKRARKVLNELEQYRAIVFHLFNIEDGTELVPVRIYATKSQSDIEDMTGSQSAAGVYTQRREGPLFILNISGGFTDKSQAKSITLHEYTHHLIAQHTEQTYPRWVSEGMAEYLSTFTASSKAKVQIGLPNQSRGQTLGSFEWISWDIVMGSIRRYPFGNATGRSAEIGKSLFYAQSWLAVHYIQSTPGMSSKLNDYVKGVPLALDPQAYFAEVFGMTPEVFGVTVRQYYKNNRYSGARFDMAEAHDDNRIEVRELSKGEVAFHLGEATRQFRAHREDGRELAREFYTDAEKKDGPLAQIYASQALISIAADDAVDARRHITKAQALSPDDGRVLYIAAKVALAEYEDSTIPSTTQDMETARDLFVEALKADPFNVQAHFDYAMTYVETGDSPSKQAIQSAKESTLQYRSTDFVDDNMRLASLFLRADEYSYARYHLERASLWARIGRTRTAARRMLENLPSPE